MDPETKRLYRSQVNRLLGGVCGGLGEFLGIDPTVIRLLFVLALIFGHAFVALLYIVMLIVVPENPHQTAPVYPPQPPIPPTPPEG